VDRLRHYRALVATRQTRLGRPLEGRSVLDPHKALMTFFRWAPEEGYEVDGEILGLKRPKVPEKEPTVFHVNELRAILAACNKALPGLYRSLNISWFDSAPPQHPRSRRPLR
jgi:site-specific recombinase XerD